MFRISAGARHPPKFWTPPLAPADFEVLNTNWHPQSSFYVTSGTLSFKFLTQALNSLHELNVCQIVDGLSPIMCFCQKQKILFYFQNKSLVIIKCNIIIEDYQKVKKSRLQFYLFCPHFWRWDKIENTFWNLSNFKLLYRQNYHTRLSFFTLQSFAWMGYLK